VLERLFAGVILIGALLWGASILASPDDPDDPEARGIQEETLPVDARIVPERGSGGDDDDRDDDDDDDRGEREPRRKGKRARD